MCPYDGDISRLWVGIIKRDILRDREFRAIQVSICGCGDILSGMSAIDRVLHLAKIR